MKLSGYVANLYKALRGFEAKVTDASDLTWTQLVGQPSSKAGVAVNVDSAFRVSTVQAATRVLSEGVAYPPLKLFEVTDTSRKPATSNPLYKLLARRPNEFQTSFEMREMMMIHAVLAGNGFAYVGRGGTKREIQEIIPIATGVRVEQLADYTLLYHVQGMSDPLTADNVLHLRGPSWNGYLGMDAVRTARESIGLAIATEETHARLFANSARPGGVLSIEGSLSKDSKDALKARIAEQQEGLHNQFKTLVIDQSAKWQTMAMTGVDSQHLETRRFQIEEICRALRVFPQMVMHSDKTSTFASAEQFFLAHVTYSLMPWIARWEQMIEHQLLGNADNLIAKFSLAALLRGDAAQRSTFYEKALGGSRGETAYMTRNEVRALEELDPIEGGDVLPTPTPPTAPIGGADVNPQKPSVPTPITVTPAGKLLWNGVEVGGIADLPFFKFNENHGEHGRFAAGSGGGTGTVDRVRERFDAARQWLGGKSAGAVLSAIATDHRTHDALSFALQSLVSHGTGFLSHMGLGIPNVQGLDASTWHLNEAVVEHVIGHFGDIAQISALQAKDMMQRAVGGLIAARQAQVDRRKSSDENQDDTLDILLLLQRAIENYKPSLPADKPQ